MAATLRIQSDWSQALRRDEGEAWLSCRSPGKPTLYGSLTRRGLSTEGVPDIAASEGFVVGEVTKKSILISCPHENVSTKFLAPYTTFCRIHQKSISAESQAENNNFLVKFGGSYKKIGVLRARFQSPNSSELWLRVSPHQQLAVEGGMQQSV